MARRSSRRKKTRFPKGLFAFVLLGIGIYFYGPANLPLIGGVFQSKTPLIAEHSDTAEAAQADGQEPALQPLSVSTDNPDGATGTKREEQGSNKPAEAERVEVLPPTTQPVGEQINRFSADTNQELKAGLDARKRGELVAARNHLNRALHSGMGREDVRRVRQMLSDMGKEMIFSRRIIDGDPLVESYQVQSGDTLGKIAKRFNVSENLLADINELKDKNFIRLGMRLKVVHGPFHVVISKSDHQMHVYLQEVYVRTLPVALGTDGSTPTGRWKVINHQENPGWTDPRTGKRWHPDDPANPIGEYWIGLEGLEGDAVGAFGYGIHGTIEPETIGEDVSLGCVRLGPEDINLVYKMLMPGESLATIID